MSQTPDKKIFGILITLLLIFNIILGSFLWLSTNEAGNLREQNDSLQNQNHALENQIVELNQTQNPNDQLQNQIQELQIELNETRNQNNSLQDQNNLLQDQIAEVQADLDEVKNQNTQLQEQIAQLEVELNETRNQTSDDSSLKVSARISNITMDGPYSIVFGASGYHLDFTIRNTGDVAIENITMEGNLTLSDGESAKIGFNDEVTRLGVGESRRVYCYAVIYNVVVNLYGMTATWHIVVRTPEGILTTLN